MILHGVDEKKLLLLILYISLRIYLRGIFKPEKQERDMDTQPSGTTQTKELIHLILTVVSVVKDASADGKIDTSDMALIFKLIPAVGPGIGGIGQIPGEIGHLDPAEAADLVAFIVSELSIDDGKAKDVINASLKTLVAVVELIAAVKA